MPYRLSACQRLGLAPLWTCLPGGSRVFPDFSVAKDRAQYVGLLEADDRDRYIDRESLPVHERLLPRPR
jgi:hypothetical protein